MLLSEAHDNEIAVGLYRLGNEELIVIDVLLNLWVRVGEITVNFGSVVPRLRWCRGNLTPLRGPNAIAVAKACA